MRNRKTLTIFILAGVFTFSTLMCTAFSWPWDDGDEKKFDISDQNIKTEINSEFIIDDAVSSHLIDVEVVEGVVTLRGSVNTMLAKDRAVRLASTIKGVRSVIDKLKINGVKRPDGEIRKDVENALLLDPATESYEVKTKVSNGVVTLKGSVESWTEKELAGNVAKGVKGVRGLSNQIKVDYAEFRSDFEIKEDIERKLEIDPYIYSGMIDVMVDDRDVTLTGSVGSASEKNFAYYDALFVNGVEDVENNIKVEPWLGDDLKKESKYTSKSDKEIKKAVKDAFVYDPRVWSFDIDISVENGIVTLGGIVDNLKAKKAAMDDAKNTIGVAYVYNNIIVRPEVSRTDDEIKRDVRSAFKRDPYIYRHDMTINVLNGKVYLYGKVDSYFEKEKAEDVASRVPGVVEIDNNIDVHYELTTDTEIRRDIKNQLEWSYKVDENEINVSVEDGVATLTGEVDSWQEYNAAVENAFEGGARVVESKLNVDGEHYDSFPPYYYYDYYNWYY